MPIRTRLALWSIDTGTSRTPCHSPKPYFEKIKWNWTIEEIDSVVISNTISRMWWWKSGVRSYVPTHEPESKAPSPGFAGTIAGYEHWVWKLSARRERAGLGRDQLIQSVLVPARPGPWSPARATVSQSEGEQWASDVSGDQLWPSSPVQTRREQSV